MSSFRVSFRACLPLRALGAFALIALGGVIGTGPQPRGDAGASRALAASPESSLSPAARSAVLGERAPMSDAERELAFTEALLDQARRDPEAALRRAAALPDSARREAALERVCAALAEEASR